MKFLFMLLWACALPLLALTYYSEENQPLNGQGPRGEASGFSVELLTLVWQEMGEKEHPIHFLPWAQGWYLLTQQPGAVLFATSHTRARSPHFLWACPISVSKISLIGRKQDKHTITSLDDLRPLRIGAMKADVGEQLLLNAGIAPQGIMSVERMDQVVRQLALARTDLVSANQDLLFHQIGRMGFNPAEFQVVAILSQQENCFAFNPATDPRKVERFQQALMRVMQSQAYRTLTQKYAHMLNFTLSKDLAPLLK
ncbi:substrate-binding periplasmic protein [Aeromonas diversa]|uniref:ABC-type amino acid transporter periplasmic binding protein n=1 Tax=Aeromonas diversa CDC 2478-85 TaxID=1268237 RepID=N9VJW4_9GAMM|nr:transporter substrate-binding domain-containing protein [Aeromonas diversa]ENY71646.1 ABC-type amino acid transporter periplasmic binding protein [Aeromonas diversa CDC 2478-85]